MENHHHQKIREKKIEEGAQFNQEQIANEPTSPPSQHSSSSSSSSPSHEFSFTISLHSSSTKKLQGESKTPPSLALDLSPADDIFFHGHLLPLHLLSHLPSSPRSSTNSMESFTLPIKGLLEDENPIKENGTFNTINRGNITKDSSNNNKGSNIEGKSKPPFSLFRLRKEHKGYQVRDYSKEDKEKHKKKLKFDVIHALKKYLRMVQPLVIFKGRREKFRLHGQSYSYSGNVTPRNKQELRGWKGQYSAPASMRTSPTNSGLLVATNTLPPTSDSTMEELQAAIQAAIAHCKNSIAKEEKVKC